MLMNRKKYINTLKYGASYLVVSSFLAFGGYAQDSDEAEIELETITVTAQFREQRLQDVPAVVKAFTAQEIEDAGIRGTQDFIALTPNLTFDDSFTYLNSFVVIRGVTQINNADSPIAIVVDGVPQNNQKQLKMPLFDVQQIEVLKGPQGSLYGRNAIGGAINIVTKQPTNEYEGFVRGSYGNGDALRLEAGVGGPIAEDKVLFRLSGSYFETDGLIENTFLNDEVDFVNHDYSIRGKLAVNLSDSVTLDLRASFNDFEAGSSFDTIVNSLANPGFRSGNDSNTVFAPDSNLAGITTGEIFELSSKLDVEFDFATLTYILGYTELEEDYRADLDFSNSANDTFGLGFGLGQGQDLDVSLFSHELRLVSPDDQAIRWIAGAYYLDTDRSLLTRGFADFDGSFDQFDTGFVILERNEDNNNQAWALFGQVEVDLSEKFTLQLGARYDEDERNQVIPGIAGSNRGQTFDSFQPKVTLSYDVSEDALAYLTYSTGFRSGGFNAPGVVLETFADEELSNFEAGFKTEFLDGKGSLNIAGFLSQSDNFQFFFVDVSTLSQIISNLDEVDIVGFDADISIRATDELSLYAGIGYTDSDIKNVGNAALENFLTSSGVNTGLVVGNRSPRTTDWTINLGGQFFQPVSEGINMVLRADYEYQGSKYWQIDNMDVRDPIHLMAVRGSLEGEGWALSMWVKNLFDEGYYADFNPSEYAGAPFDLGFQARPRTYGIDLSYKF